MKFTLNIATCFFASLCLLLSACVQPEGSNTDKKPQTTEDLITKAVQDAPAKPLQLPVRYQTPGYVTANEVVDKGIDETEEYKIKVGANIRSTRGPQPLWDIMKRLASLKNMNVSWESDVDQNALVDVDIRATDDFFDAIDNLLRQLDYFHEVKDSTIIVKYKETKRYHVAMPFTHQVYETATGGNILGSKNDTSSVEGKISLDSTGNEFDIWENIKLNLDSILEIWSGRRENERRISDIVSDEAQDATRTYQAQAKESKSKDQSGKQNSSTSTTDTAVNARTANGYYTIDKPVGIITVTAPRTIINKVDDYIEELTKVLYKQVSIEAKIIEVQLADNSTLGINWNLLLNNLSFGATLGLDKSYGSNRNINKKFENHVNNKYTRDTVLNTDDVRYEGKNKDGIDWEWNRGDINKKGRPDGELSGQQKVFDSLTSTNQLNELDGLATTATILTAGASNAASGLLSLASFKFSDFLHALSEQGQTTILANPKLSVMNGQPALITVGRNVTYIDSIESKISYENGNRTADYTVNTERVLSGVGLSLTPIIRDDGTIIMNLVPVTSVLEEPIEYRTVGEDGQVGLPIIDVREMSSMVKIKDGEMLVIGGLISSVEAKEGNNLFPGLADVPVLKYLTGYETKVMKKRELIILLRPRIL